MCYYQNCGLRNYCSRPTVVVNVICQYYHYYNNNSDYNNNILLLYYIVILYTLYYIIYYYYNNNSDLFLFVFVYWESVFRFVIVLHTYRYICYS